MRQLANANFYADRANSYQIRWNNANNGHYATTPFEVIQGHWFWYKSKAHMRLPISH